MSSSATEEFIANAVTLATLMGLAMGAAQARTALPQAFSKIIQQNDLTIPREGHKISSRSSEIQVFLRLPPPLRRQLLRYGERWREGLSR